MHLQGERSRCKVKSTPCANDYKHFPVFLTLQTRLWGYGYRHMRSLATKVVRSSLAGLVCRHSSSPQAVPVRTVISRALTRDYGMNCWIWNCLIHSGSEGARGALAADLQPDSTSQCARLSTTGTGSRPILRLTHIAAGTTTGGRSLAPPETTVYYWRPKLGY